MTFRLPISGIAIEFREPTGIEDVRLMLPGESVDKALWVVSTLGWPLAGDSLAWESLTITDLDAAMLEIRRVVVGETLRTTVRCGCGERADIEFDIAEYIAGHRPRSRADVREAGAPGWFAIDGVDAIFRLPSCADQRAIALERDPVRALARRCIDPKVGRAERRRIEAAMERLAPNLFGALEGTCPRCGSAMHMAFDPQQYVLQELRQRAAFVFEEVHLIAGRYGWSEADILTLPAARRARYAELVSASSGANLTMPRTTYLQAIALRARSQDAALAPLRVLRRGWQAMAFGELTTASTAGPLASAQHPPNSAGVEQGAPEALEATMSATITPSRARPPSPSETPASTAFASTSDDGARVLDGRAAAQSSPGSTARADFGVPASVALEPIAIRPQTDLSEGPRGGEEPAVDEGSFAASRVSSGPSGSGEQPVINAVRSHQDDPPSRTGAGVDRPLNALERDERSVGEARAANLGLRHSQSLRPESRLVRDHEHFDVDEAGEPENVNGSRIATTGRPQTAPARAAGPPSTDTRPPVREATVAAPPSTGMMAPARESATASPTPRRTVSARTSEPIPLPATPVRAVVSALHTALQWVQGESATAPAVRPPTDPGATPQGSLHASTQMDSYPTRALRTQSQTPRGRAQSDDSTKRPDAAAALISLAPLVQPTNGTRTRPRALHVGVIEVEVRSEARPAAPIPPRAPAVRPPEATISRAFVNALGLRQS